MTARRRCRLCKKRHPPPGKKTCGPCGKKNNARLRYLYSKRVRSGKCTRCGKKMLGYRQKFLRCARCRRYIRETVKKAYQRRKR